jgi:DNA polymerase-3 subunit gamma/tau
VAVAAPQSQSKAVEPVQTGSVSNTPQTPPPSAPSTPRPTLKTGSIGITWNNLRGSGRKLKIQLPSDVAASNGQSTEQANFSLDELQLQWVAMCNRMPERLSGIAARMKNMNPVIRRMPEVEVVVPNEIIKDEMEQIRGSIVNTLKIYLRNNKITLSLSVADQTEREVVLSRRQQFDLMTSKNPAIERLRKEFGLELV